MNVLNRYIKAAVMLVIFTGGCSSGANYCVPLSDVVFASSAAFTGRLEIEVVDYANVFYLYKVDLNHGHSTVNDGSRTNVQLLPCASIPADANKVFSPNEELFVPCACGMATTMDG